VVTFEDFWVPDLTLLETLKQLSLASDIVVVGRHSDDGRMPPSPNQSIGKSIV
jgi:hypothetical protein